VSTTLREMWGLRVHSLRATPLGHAPKDIVEGGIPLCIRGRAIGPVVPVTLTPQIRHVHHTSDQPKEMCISKFEGWRLLCCRVIGWGKDVIKGIRVDRRERSGRSKSSVQGS
jgi:hypothetical protein